jgi:hypothetical protein
MNYQTLSKLVRAAEKIGEHEREHHTIARNRHKIEKGLDASEKAIQAARQILAKVDR